MQNKHSPKIPEISVVVPISERHDDIKKLYHLYASEFKIHNKEFEFIFVVDGSFDDAYDDLMELKNTGNPLKIIKFSKSFGEAAALTEGFRQAKGEAVLTLAAYIQIEPKDLGKVFCAYDEGCDLVITRRFPRIDPLINRIQSYVYHLLVRKLTGAPFKDITSGMRLINRKICHEFNLYGDLHRFIPIIAYGKGIKVCEVNVGQREEDTRVRFVNPSAYARRVLDLLTLFFLIKFTVKPLRFFGLIGAVISIPGFIIAAYLGVLKLLGKTDLANRPLLLLGVLLIVFGLQLFSVGMIGELILYTRSKDMIHYRVEKIIQ